MSKETGVISIYLSKEQLKELDRRANYQRITRGEWAKNRVLSALHIKKVV